MADKIYIMHILYGLGMGGLEKRLTSLINDMDKNVFSHSICTFSDDFKGREYIKNMETKYFLIKKKYGNDFTVPLRLAGLLRKEKPVIVRTYNWSGIYGIIAARLSWIPIIIHSEHGFNIDEMYQKKNRRIIARRILLSGVDKIIAVSKGLEKWLHCDIGIPQDKIAYISNGCDLDSFRPGKNDLGRRGLGIEEKDFVIGTVGTLNELKDQKTLISAFAQINKNNSSLKLLIVGDGPERKGLETLGQHLGVAKNIIFTGIVKGPQEIYRVMDIFVLPSRSENCPNAILEAMATGLPIVATNVGDVGYMLGGENGGIIVNPGNAVAIANGIKQFLDDPNDAKARGCFSRKRAEELFDSKKVVSLYGKLYLDLLKTKGIL